MAHWIRYRAGGTDGFGTLEGETIHVHAGDMFAAPKATGQTVPLASVELLTPCQPSKIIALWNNLRGLGAKLNVPPPEVPLFLLKAVTSSLPHGGEVKRPKSYAGKVIFEGELGIVIGKTLKDATEAEAAAGIFGFTCVNDFTAAELIAQVPTFAQWARSKSYDTFGAFGPVISTGIDVSGASIRTIVNGQERQNYPVSEMYFQPAALVARLSEDMTLLPGDLIMCGTSTGAGVMRDAQNTVEVIIDGIGTLRNTFAA